MKTDTALAAMLRRIDEQFAPRLIMMSGSAARGDLSDDSDVDLVVVVSERLVQRLRCRVESLTFDVFIFGEGELQRMVHEGRQSHVVTMLADAVFVSGDRALATALTGEARTVRERVPRPTEAELFRSACEPFDLLRAFRRARNDPENAAFLLSALVGSCTQAFFTLRRIRTTNSAGVLDLVRSIDPEAFAALASVLRAPVAELCRNDEPVREMVRALAGEERTNERALVVVDTRSPRRGASRAASSHVRASALQPPALARLSGHAVAALSLQELQSMSRLQLLTIQRMHDEHLNEMQRRCVVTMLATGVPARETLPV